MYHLCKRLLPTTSSSSSSSGFLTDEQLKCYPVPPTHSLSIMLVCLGAWLKHLSRHAKETNNCIIRAAQPQHTFSLEVFMAIEHLHCYSVIIVAYDDDGGWYYYMSSKFWSRSTTYLIVNHFVIWGSASLKTQSASFKTAAARSSDTAGVYCVVCSSCRQNNLVKIPRIPFFLGTFTTLPCIEISFHRIPCLSLWTFKTWWETPLQGFCPFLPHDNSHWWQKPILFDRTFWMNSALTFEKSKSCWKTEV